jgi:hypothetical protein
MTDAVPDTGDGPVGEQNGGTKNIRSTIGFPYSHLGDAERVAAALHNRGNTATMGEVAAELGTTTNSGTFRTKISTARVFGAIVNTRGQVSLTDLGCRLADPTAKGRARVDAFLNVPLYKAIYDKYDGSKLPSAKGLEAAIQQLGVSPKQLDRARQALQRSAELAGFFRNGSDRLVVPPVGASAGEEGDNQGAGAGNEGKVASVVPLPPVMVEMWLTLLRGDGAKWPDAKVAEFVKAAQRLDKILASS